MENKKRGVVIDTRTVNIDDDYAVEYWTRQLNTTQAKLLAAVNEVGNDYAEVKKQLKKS